MAIWKSVENLANVATVVGASCLVVMLGMRYFGPAASPSQASTTLAAGTPLDIPALPKQSEPVLFVFLSTTCRYCIADAPFYQEMSKAPANVKVVFGFREPVEKSKAFLEQFGIVTDDVIELRQPALPLLRVTPMIVLLDKDRKVMRSWTGQLSAEGRRNLMELQGKKENPSPGD
jgi:thiol-disulfide isomerase/thioredoxin